MRFAKLLLQCASSGSALRSDPREGGRATASAPTTATDPDTFAGYRLACESGTIFLPRGADDLVPMTEAPYDSEDVLQELLAKFPDLLVGDQLARR